MKYPHEKAVQAILYGHSYAMQLKLRLEDPEADDGSVLSYDLIKSIIDCFSRAIADLSDKPKFGDEQISQVSSHSLPQMCNSKKRKISKTSSSKNWRDDSPNPIYYDGFHWRKYGEKYIKNSDYQRSYYKCSYYIDHQCGARKHEEKIKDNPPVYRTTYFGNHICQINHNQNAISTTVIDPVDCLDNARTIRFGEDQDQDKENHLGGLCLSVKHKDDFKEKEAMDEKTKDIDQNVMEENLSSLSSYEYNSELLWDNLEWCDLYHHF